MPPLGKEGDSRYLKKKKKGEMHELRMELHSQDKSVKVDAVKKVIASMTVGKDVYDAYYKMEVVEHFAEISLISRLLGGERLLPRKEVSRLLDLRQKVYGLDGPPRADGSCPVPAEDTMSALTGAPSIDNGDERIEMTRSELVQLISDAIRDVSA